MKIKKYRLICKKDYTEAQTKNVLEFDVVNTYLYKGVCYDIEEELWNHKGDIMRRAWLSDGNYVGFLTIPFYDYFYTEAEIRDMKLQEIGIDSK